MPVVSRLGTIAAVLISVLPAAAEMSRYEWFKSLMQPGGEIPCCDIADCRRTTARWQGNRWWADINGKWTPVPDSKVLVQPKSLDGDAYICVSEPLTDDAHPTSTQIYCFVPPNFGS